jgi:hypothetical protein
MANPGLNGLIVFVLLLGILYAFRMVWRLFREVNWVNHFRIAEPGLDIGIHAAAAGADGRAAARPPGDGAVAAVDALAARLARLQARRGT